MALLFPQIGGSFIIKKSGSLLAKQGKWWHATLRRVHEDADSVHGDTSFRCCLLVSLIGCNTLRHRFPAMMDLASLQGGVVVEMIALLLPDAMDRRLRLLCLLCIFLFFLVGPASRWVHAGVPKSQGFTQSSILRHAVPLLWLNYCLGPNYGRLWLHVCRCFSVLPSELCLLKFGSDENQLFVLVFTSLFVFLKSSYHTHHHQIRSAFLHISAFGSVSHSSGFTSSISNGVASTSAKRPEPCGSSLSVWSALTKLSWCEKRQWVTVVTLPILKQCLQAAAPPAARTHSRLTALQTGR